MKKLIICLLALATIALAQDNGQSDFRTLKVAWTQTRWDNLTVRGKIINTLIKYQFSSASPTTAMTNSVLAQINTTSFVATVNTNLAVHVYDYSLPKARPNEPDSMTWADLAVLKAKVDADPQIAMDIVRRSQSEKWYTDNGISHRPAVQP